MNQEEGDRVQILLLMDLYQMVEVGEDLPTLVTPSEGMVHLVVAVLTDLLLVLEQQGRGWLEELEMRLQTTEQVVVVVIKPLALQAQVLTVAMEEMGGNLRSPEQ
jgi:hypothetical protein